MLASHAALCGATGSAEMSVFQTLSAGNSGQPGAPGTAGPASGADGGGCAEGAARAGRGRADGGADDGSGRARPAWSTLSWPAAERPAAGADGPAGPAHAAAIMP